MRYVLLLLVTAAVIGGGYLLYTHATQEHAADYRTATVKRGELVSTISATGTIEPEEVIDIGAQVAGLIKNLGRDLRDATKSIDYGSEVEAHTVLANIDPALYQAQYNQAKANLEQSEANLLNLQAKLDQTERDWKRAQVLRPLKSIADVDYDTAQYAFESAKAALAVGRATIEQNKASQELAATNLGYCTIASPVKGVIIDRRVNVGQTVVSALNAPSLFLLAKDLKRMQVWAQVNEADIGRIHVDQSVTFTVDAFSGETFKGSVGQIRLNAQMTQNVVTYTVVVNTDNSNGKLLPYLTANLQFELEKRTDVLKVPSMALKWKPQPQAVAPDARAALLAGGPKRDSAHARPDVEAVAGAEAQPRGKADRLPGGPADRLPGGPADRLPGGPADGKHGGLAAARHGKPGDKLADKAAEKLGGKPVIHESRGRVWIVDGTWVRPIEVHVGLTDGNDTEVSGRGLQDGMEVITGEIRHESGDASGTSNPFAPKIFGGKKS